MDVLNRVVYYFPASSLTAYQIVANIVISNMNTCLPQQQNMLIALTAIFSCLVFCMCFTDTYTTHSGEKYSVILFPFLGPKCFNLPSEEDKDQVWDWYQMRKRDYLQAVMSTSCFVLVSMFSYPAVMCLFPSGNNDGTTRFGSSVVRTVPLAITLAGRLLAVCLGPPRQMFGFQNAPLTQRASYQINSAPAYQPDEQGSSDRNEDMTHNQGGEPGSVRFEDANHQDSTAYSIYKAKTAPHSAMAQNGASKSSRQQQSSALASATVPNRQFAQLEVSNMS